MGKKSTPAAPESPDYAALAKQEAEDARKLLGEQTVANRPNQYNAYGSTEWTKDGAGNWTQIQKLNPAEQAQLDANRGIQKGLTDAASGLLGKTQSSLNDPLSLEGLPEWQQYDLESLQDVDPSALTAGLPSRGTAPGVTSGGVQTPQAGLFNMDPRGNSQDVQDATYKLLAPQREMARSGEVQRLKNQGLTENSPAFQRAMTRLDQGDTEAQLRALLAGKSEYGNEFARGVQGNQLNFGQGMDVANFESGQNQQEFGQGMDVANFNSRENQGQYDQNLSTQNFLSNLRKQQFGEQDQAASQVAALRSGMLNERNAVRQAPLNDLRSLMGANPSNPAFAGFASSGLAPNADLTGAASNTYQDQMNAYNAQMKSKDNGLGGLFGLAGSILGGPAGSVGGTMLSKLFGG